MVILVIKPDGRTCAGCSTSGPEVGALAPVVNGTMARKQAVREPIRNVTFIL